jgi:small-conductance mechanosensitive channel
VADRIARRTSATWDERLVECLRAPVRAFLGVLVFGWLVGPLRLALPVQRVTDLGCRTALILAAAWAGLRLVDFVAKTVEEGLGASGGEQGGRARGVRTAVVVLRRVAQLVVGLGAAALVLTQFEVVRNLGVSLLASAGLAGIVVGLAAQKSITSLLAGLQLSITQPVRLGDTVIVEGEWGTIEEINLTYVVVRVWDLRRLVVPVSRFLDQPFQNWTKVSTEIMGTVEIVADYKAPIDAVRAELQRLCKASARWDAKVCGLQVTAMSERTMTLRALVSSADAGKNWELRCEVREGLIKFLQGLEGGRFLPRTRVGDEGALGPAEEAARNVVAASS